MTHFCIRTPPKPPSLTAVGEYSPPDSRRLSKDYHDGKMRNYKIIKALGLGASATVVAAVHKITKAKVALKTIDEQFYCMYPEFIQREVRAQRGFKHKNILELKDVIMEEGSPTLVFEKARIGLYELMAKKNRGLSTASVKSIISQILSALVEIHKNGIIHRDIKLENILVAYDGSIKLADFGFAIERKETIHGNFSVAGTPEYMPPDVFMNDGSYDEKFDIWSVGMLTILLLNRQHHYQLSDVQSLSEVRIILKSIYRSGGLDWDSYRGLMDPDALKFLKTLLRVDPTKRPSAKECLKLPWLKNAKHCSIKLNKKLKPADGSKADKQSKSKPKKTKANKQKKTKGRKRRRSIFNRKDS